MSVRQAGAPITDEELRRAASQGGYKREREWFNPANKDGPLSIMDTKCRLYPRLSFFFDGTGNNLEIDTPLQRLSNVAKLYNAAIEDSRGQGATRTYIPGVGTLFKFPKVVGYTDMLKDDPGGNLGMGMGAGGEMRIQFALAEFSRILEREWGLSSWKCMQFISVSIFGFSRGATLARAFVRRLIATKCLSIGEGENKSLIWRAPSGERIPLRVHFMGLFDTVASVGGPTWHLSWASELAIPPEVERCVHFVAGHEVRRAFSLDIVRVNDKYPSNCFEVVYPGAHADIGGGYGPQDQGRSNRLTRIPLRDMLAEAVRAGVPIRLPEQLQDDIRADFELDDNEPLVSVYKGYLEALPEASGTDVASLMQAHRRLNFQWRGALARQGTDTRVLGRLYGKVSTAMCQAVAPTTDGDHPACEPTTWIYEVPPRPEEQARQLLGEQRRLARHVEYLRNPVPANRSNRDWPTPEPRKRTPYEDLILAAWDERQPVAQAVDALLAEHIHDSVAHFTSWPCALYEQRGVYADGPKSYAGIGPHDARDDQLATA